MNTRLQTKKQMLLGNKNIDIDIALEANAFKNSNVTSRSPPAAISTPFPHTPVTIEMEQIGATALNTNSPTQLLSAPPILSRNEFNNFLPPKSPPPPPPQSSHHYQSILPVEIPFDDADTSRAFINTPKNNTYPFDFNIGTPIASKITESPLTRFSNTTLTSTTNGSPRVATKQNFTKSFPKRVTINETVERIQNEERTGLERTSYLNFRGASNNSSTLNHTISEIENLRQPITPNYAQPPYFNPATDNPIEFLKAYKIASQANNWNDMLQMCYFVNCLRDSAAIWFRNFAKRNPNANWAKTLKAFKDTFVGPNHEEDLKYKLVSRRQKPDESLLEYYYAIIDLCDELDLTLDDNEMMRRVTSGLLPYYKHMFTISRPKTLIEFESLIESVSETERESTVYHDKSKTVEKREDLAKVITSMSKDITNLVLAEIRKDLQREKCESQVKNESTLERPYFQASGNRQNNYKPSNIQRSRTTDGRPICYNCNRSGHIAANCRMRNKYMTNNQNSRHLNDNGRGQ